MVALSPTRLGIRLEEPSRISLGRFYLGGPFVRWNPDAQLVEDNFEHEQTLVDSFKRLSEAIRVEYGRRLRITSATFWDGVCDNTRSRICAALNWQSN